MRLMTAGRQETMGLWNKPSMRRPIALLTAKVIVCISSPIPCTFGDELSDFSASIVEQPAASFRRSWPQIHDPSTILKAGDRYWCFSTGMGVQSMSSVDLSQWRLERPVFEQPPAWVINVVPSQRGHFWAPDIIEWKGQYRLYYSVSAFGKRTSAIALATTKSLDPQADDYGWTDEGIVVQTTEVDDFNAIDPAVVATTDGELWLVFGSFWSGVKLIQLDPETGNRLFHDSPMHALAWKEQIEAPAIYSRDGHYYLFVNWGLCCRGVRSTYNIRVGRSREITGPYLDRDGVNMLDGGGTLVLDTRGSAIGPGHAAFFERDGRLMLSYHYYDGDRRGQPVLGINELSWDAQGWPLVADEQSFTDRIPGSDNQGNQSPNSSTATAP